MQRWRQVAEALGDLLTVVNSGRPVPEILEAILDQAGRLLGSEGASLYLLDEESNGTLLRVQAASGLAPDMLAETVRVGSPVTGLAVQERRPVAAWDLEATLADHLVLPGQTELEDRRTYLRVLRMGPALDPDLDREGSPRVRLLTTAFRAALAVPLVTRSAVFGAISLYYCTPRSFSEVDVELVSKFADQAALAIENARMRVQAERSLHELEALYHADEPIYRSLELADVLQALVDVAADVLGADKTSCLVWDAERQRLLPGAAHGFRAETLAAMSHAVDEGITGRVFKTGCPIAVGDALADPRVKRSIVTAEGIRSLMHVPLRIGGEVFGVFGVNYCSPHRFSDREERMLLALARRAAMAIANARLYGRAEEQAREAERRRQVAEGLGGLLAVVNSGRSLDEILADIVARARGLLDSDASAIFLPTPTDQLAVRASSGLPPALAALTVLFGAPTTGLAYTTGRPVVVTDASDPSAMTETGDPHEEPQVEDHATYLHVLRVPDRFNPHGEHWRLGAGAVGFRGLLSVALAAKGERYGVLTLYSRRPRVYGAEEVDLARAFADQSALAIENARLREAAQQVAALEERQRLARELHDAVTQSLFSASLIADVLPRIWERNQVEGQKRLIELGQLTRGALAEMRTLLLELRPSAVTQVPLEDLLRQQAETIAGHARLQVTVAAEGAARTLPPDVHVALYRLAQEALNNVAKHADAEHAAVQLAWTPGQVALAIQDDGHGFDSTVARPGHLGLDIMRERAGAIGALLHVDSRKGQGTCVRIAWPAPTGESRAAG